MKYYLIVPLFITLFSCTEEIQKSTTSTEDSNFLDSVQVVVGNYTDSMESIVNQVDGFVGNSTYNDSLKLVLSQSYYSFYLKQDSLLHFAANYSRENSISSDEFYEFLEIHARNFKPVRERYENFVENEIMIEYPNSLEQNVENE